MDAFESCAADICEFSDPYTDVRVKSWKKGLRADIVRNGRPVSFNINSDGVISEIGGRAASFQSIGSLLASERFANLRQFSATQLLSLRTAAVKNLIPSSVRVGREDLDTQGIAEILTSGEDGRLKLLLIDGPAGIGKTFHIQRLVLKQAERFQKGDVVAPVLHVSSKGRRLSNLQDVLAAATQDLNASFFARHVPVLVRRGLLVVAIDGFDELLDADGYEDSWLALRRFVESVGQSGGLLLAARDTFVEEQDLLVRIERTRESVNLVTGEVRGPNTAQALQWLSTSPSWKPAEIESDKSADLLRNESYALRPFFLREFWGMKGWSEISDQGPRTILVNRLLGREAKLIAQQIGGVTADELQPALFSFLREVALEMAVRESDMVEVEHLGFLTQYCFDGVVNELSIRKLIHKSSSMALLELSPDKNYRKFPHTEVRSYFLGLSLISSLAVGELPMFLRRYQINCDELEVFSELVVNSNKESSLAAIYAASLLSSQISNDELAPNLSALVLLFFATGHLARVDYAECVEASFAGGAPRGAIAESKFGRVDCCGADISDVHFSGVTIGTLIVDDSTLVGDSCPEVFSLEVRSNSGNYLLREQKAILEWFTNRKRPLVGGDSSAVRLLEKVARASIRQFYLRSIGDEDEGSALLAAPEWKLVSRVLSRHNRLEVHRAKPMHGRPSPLIRIKNPAALLDRSDKETNTIIDEIVGHL